MRKLAVLALALLLVPSAFAIVSQRHEASLLSNFITQGYSFARVQGFNNNNAPVNIVHWHTDIQLGLNRAFCELQPAVLPPGPYDIEIALQCQTGSGFTVLFPSGTKVEIDSFIPDDSPSAAFTVEKLQVITGPRLPTPFPVTAVGHVVLDESASAAGTFMFFAGVAAIVILAVTVILFSLRRDEDE